MFISYLYFSEQSKLHFPATVLVHLLVTNKEIFNHPVLQLTILVVIDHLPETIRADNYTTGLIFSS